MKRSSLFLTALACATLIGAALSPTYLSSIFGDRSGIENWPILLLVAVVCLGSAILSLCLFVIGALAAWHEKRRGLAVLNLLIVSAVVLYFLFLFLSTRPPS